MYIIFIIKQFYNYSNIQISHAIDKQVNQRIVPNKTSTKSEEWSKLKCKLYFNCRAITNYKHAYVWAVAFRVSASYRCFTGAAGVGSEWRPQ